MVLIGHIFQVILVVILVMLLPLLYELSRESFDDDAYDDQPEIFEESRPIMLEKEIEIIEHSHLVSLTDTFGYHYPQAS